MSDNNGNDFLDCCKQLLVGWICGHKRDKHLATLDISFPMIRRFIANISACFLNYQFLSTPVLMHGELICITFCLSVCYMLQGWFLS